MEGYLPSWRVDEDRPLPSLLALHVLLLTTTRHHDSLGLTDMLASHNASLGTGWDSSEPGLGSYQDTEAAVVASRVEPFLVAAAAAAKEAATVVEQGLVAAAKEVPRSALAAYPEHLLRAVDVAMDGGSADVVATVVAAVRAVATVVAAVAVVMKEEPGPPAADLLW